MKINLDRINNVLEIISLFFIVLMVILVWMQVFLRYIFKFSPSWSEDTARFFMIWALLLGAAVVIRKGGHIRVDFLIEAIPSEIAKLINIVLTGLALAFSIIFTIYGLEAAITQRSVSCTSVGIGLSMFWPYLILPVSGFFMTVNLFVDIWTKITGKEETQGETL